MAKKKVLVVDDDEGILAAFDAMLEAEGYAVDTFSRAESLQSLDKHSLPDLILLDVLLSGTDGREVCKALKSDPLTKAIPIIMISAHPGAGQSIKKAGADDYLAKPFEMDVLLNKIAKYAGD